jgi:hypothetical protein
MDERHESAYRLLFSQPRMVKDLLRGFLREEWIGWLDPGTLERRPAPAAGTLVWRLRWQGGAAAVYLLLRPFAAADPYAAVRLWTDRGLLYQQLLARREGCPARPLPVVLPVALYGGGPPWAAARDAFELFQPIPGPLQRYLPRAPYLVLDAAHDAVPAAADDNLVALLCQLERSGPPENAGSLLERLASLLAAAGDEGLRQAWSRFLAADSVVDDPRRALYGRLPTSR